MSNVLTYDPKSFNPRTREGCDQGIVLADCIQQRFNPRTREGCDYIRFQQYMATYSFQSTHP